MGEGQATVFTARKVRTVDPGRPEAEAVAVLDGKVLSTGMMESMEPWLSHYGPWLNGESLGSSRRVSAEGTT